MIREIIIALPVYERLRALVGSEAPKECAVILAGGVSSSAEHFRLLAKEIFVPTARDYSTQEPTRVRWSEEWLRRTLLECADRNLHTVLVHSHPFSHGSASESCMDLDAAKIECPAIVAACHGMAVCTMVVDGECRSCDAHVYNVATGERDSIDRVCIPGLSEYRVIVPTSSHRDKTSMADDVYWSRVRLAFGEETLHMLRSIKVGVLGLGGLGQPISTMLARLGCPQQLVDLDLFQKENVNRSFYGNLSHVHAGISKVDLAAMAIKDSSPDADVTAICGDIRDLTVQRDLTACNVLVVTVDNVTARVVASCLAMAHGMVMFDVGTEIDVANGSLASVRGQVMRLVPGTNLCHQCAQFFDVSEVGQGLLHEDDFADERRRGYVKGANIIAPSVIAVNGSLASIAVWEMLRYFSGASKEPGADVISVDLLKNLQMAHRYDRDKEYQRVSCPTCSPNGSLFGGDCSPLMHRALRPSGDVISGLVSRKEGSDGQTYSAEPH